MTPYSLRKKLYHHLVAVGSVDFTTNNFQIDIADCWLPHWFLNGAVGRRIHVPTDAHWRVKEVSTSSSVDYLNNLSTETRRCLLEDTNWWWRGQAVSISNTIHQYSPINGLINPLFNRTDKTDGRTHQYHRRNQDALPGWYINRESDTPIDGHKSRGDGDMPCLFPIRDINIHLLIHR